MSRRYALLAACGFAVVIALTDRTALAGPATDKLRDHEAAAVALLQEATIAADTKLVELEDTFFDYGAVARAALGPEWAKRTPAEQADVVREVAPVVRKAYRRTLRDLLGARVHYAHETTDAAGVVVHLLAKPAPASGQPDVEVHFRLRARGASFVCTDIVTNSGSLGGGLRAQLVPVLRANGFAALLRALRSLAVAPDA